MPRSTIFFHIISQTALYSKKRYWTQNTWFDFLYNFSETYFILTVIEWDKNHEYIVLHVKYLLFLFYFNETWIS